jgi:hypothetical protein
MTPLIAISVITGICALLFVWLSLAGRFSDKMEAIRRVDPKRARRISTILFVVAAGLWIVTEVWDALGPATSPSSTTRVPRSPAAR